MIAIITGDVIDSQNSESKIWINKLKDLLQNWGDSPKIWEIYRGDEFQFKCEIDHVFKVFLAIKSLFKSQENMNIRMAIGIGEEQFCSEKITESNGTAYVNSGKLLDEIITAGKTLAIKTPNDNVNRDLNAVFKWCSIDFDNWTPAVAEIIHEFIMNEELTQEDLAKKLNISQSSVSQRLKRANLDLIMETNRFFQKKISEI